MCRGQGRQLCCMIFFSVLLLTDAERLNPAIVNTRAYAEWAVSHHAVMT